MAFVFPMAQRSQILEACMVVLCLAAWSFLSQQLLYVYTFSTRKWICNLHASGDICRGFSYATFYFSNWTNKKQKFRVFHIWHSLVLTFLLSDIRKWEDMQNCFWVVTSLLQRITILNRSARNWESIPHLGEKYFSLQWEEIFVSQMQGFVCLTRTKNAFGEITCFWPWIIYLYGYSKDSWRRSMKNGSKIDSWEIKNTWTHTHTHLQE